MNFKNQDIERNRQGILGTNVKKLIPPHELHFVHLFCEFII